MGKWSTQFCSAIRQHGPRILQKSLTVFMMWYVGQNRQIVRKDRTTLSMG
jgi:hypothetical protein